MYPECGYGALVKPDEPRTARIAIWFNQVRISMMLIVESVDTVHIPILTKRSRKEGRDVRYEESRCRKADRKVKMSGLHLQASRRVNVLG
jgi:hypothetical protein